MIVGETTGDDSATGHKFWPVCSHCTAVPGILCHIQLWNLCGRWRTDIQTQVCSCDFVDNVWSNIAIYVLLFNMFMKMYCYLSVGERLCLWKEHHIWCMKKSKDTHRNTVAQRSENSF